MGTEITTTWEVLKNNNHKFNNRLDDSNCNFFVCLLQSQANWLFLGWYCDAHLGNEFAKRFRDAQAVCPNLNHTEELDLNSRLLVWSVVFKSVSNSDTQVWYLLRIPYILCVSIMKYKWLMHPVRWYVCEWGLHYLPRWEEGPHINHIRSHNSVLGFWSIFKTWNHRELIYYMSKNLGIWPKNRKGIRPGVCCKCFPTFWKRSVFNLCRLGGFVNFSCMFVSSGSFLPLMLHVCEDGLKLPLVPGWIPRLPVRWTNGWVRGICPQCVATALGLLIQTGQCPFFLALNEIFWLKPNFWTCPSTRGVFFG